jgi:transmembrane sensor
MRNREYIEKLIIKSFAKPLNSEEQQVITAWLSESDENRQYYFQMKNVWEISCPAFDPDSIDVDAAEIKLIKHITQRSLWQIPIMIWWQKVAAILLLPLLMSATYFIFTHSAVSQFAWQEVNTPYGITSRIYLSDGTGVWLNSGSQLSFPVNFSRNERRVKLSGEGFFEVHSDKRHPFIVETSKMDVRATGTSFNVEAYTSDTIVAVTLVKGKIRVNMGAKTEANLRPNQRIVFNSKRGKYDILPTDAQRWTLWKDGKLVFRNEPLEDVFKRLGRAFNVDITVKESLIAKQPYRATFEGESLNEILELLKIAAPLRYVITSKCKRADGSFSKEKIEVYKQD